MGRKAVWVASLASALVLVLSYWSISSSDSDGPVDLGEGQSVVSVSSDLGDQIGFSHNTAINRGTEVITLKRVYLVDPGGRSPQVTQVWAWPLYPDSRRVMGGQWPPEQPAPWTENFAEVDGYVIQPGTPAAFTFVVDIDSEGVWVWPEMVVQYEYQGDTYTERTDSALKICAPYETECDPEL